jgi:hypothetical protein
MHPTILCNKKNLKIPINLVLKQAGKFMSKIYRVFFVCKHVVFTMYDCSTMEVEKKYIVM